MNTASTRRWLRGLAAGAALVAAGAANAGDVRWSIGIDLPLPGFHPAPVYHPVPAYRHAPIYAPAPIYYEERYPRRVYAPAPIVVHRHGHPRWVDHRWHGRDDRYDHGRHARHRDRGDDRGHWRHRDRDDDRGHRRFRHD